MGEKIKRECPACRVTYDADPARLKFGRQTTCSRICSYEFRAAQMSTSEKLQCGACGKDVIRPPSHIKSRHGAVFCSAICAYGNRKRIVEKPYVLVAEYDRSASLKKGWETRRRNGKPYPDAARRKAAARAIERVQSGFNVSKFEIKAAEVFRHIGVPVVASLAFRDQRGRLSAVFDLYLPTRHILIECHGDYWHGGRWLWDTPDDTQVRNLAHEERKVALAADAGLEVRMLWEKEFRRDPNGACLSVIR